MAAYATGDRSEVVDRSNRIRHVICDGGWLAGWRRSAAIAQASWPVFLRSDRRRSLSISQLSTRLPRDSSTTLNYGHSGALTTLPQYWRPQSASRPDFHPRPRHGHTYEGIKHATGAFVFRFTCFERVLRTQCCSNLHKQL